LTKNVLFWIQIVVMFACECAPCFDGSDWKFIAHKEDFPHVFLLLHTKDWIVRTILQKFHQ